jgi:heat-inducible transcriptional repressor
VPHVRNHAQPADHRIECARAEIFRMVVDGYLTTGQPVGSRTLSATPDLHLSPASIRSVLHELEGLGLAAPHTSAGRMPTEMGLRLFVDGMMQASEPTREEREAIERGMQRPARSRRRWWRPVRLCPTCRPVRGW